MFAPGGGLGDELADQGRLAGAGRPGDPDHVGVADVGVGEGGEAIGVGAGSFDQRQEPTDRSAVTVPGPFEQLVDPDTTQAHAAPTA